MRPQQFGFQAVRATLKSHFDDGVNESEARRGASMWYFPGKTQDELFLRLSASLEAFDLQFLAVTECGLLPDRFACAAVPGAVEWGLSSGDRRRSGEWLPTPVTE